MTKYKVNDFIGGDYHILDILGGEGKTGMGIVYIVEHKDYPLPFILKTYQSKNPIFRIRFRREAENWISLGTHPNIVKAFSLEEIDFDLFIAAEYIQGDEEGRNTLRHYVAHGKQTNESIAKWTAQFCYGMKHSLLKGIKCHRDIKPDNLMIDSNGNLKITDFGIAKVDFVKKNSSISPSFSESSSQWSFVGTPFYSSPEQIVDTNNVNHISDIYSFGIVLYELISSGQYPYPIRKNSTPDEIIRFHLSSEIIPQEHPLYNICERCLQKNISLRYQSFNDILDDLKKVCDNLKIKLPPNLEDLSNRDYDLYAKARTLCVLGKNQEALIEINALLKIDNSYYEAWNQKGKILAALGEYTEAINSTINSLNYFPHNTEALNNLGIYYKNIGDITSSIKYHKLAIKYDSGNSVTFMNLALAYSQIKDWSNATYAIIEALKLSPNNANLIFNANILAVSMENSEIESAIKILKYIIKFNQKESRSIFNLALFYFHLNDYSKAISLLNNVITLEPKKLEVYEFVIKSYIRISQFDKAINYCDFLIDNKLNLYFALGSKSEIIDYLGKTEDALEYIEHKLDLYPESVELWISKANILTRNESFNSALIALKNAEEIIIQRNEFNSEKWHLISDNIRKLTLKTS